jgi:hypothetical protein
LGSLVALGDASAWAQGTLERVGLIMSGLPPPGSPTYNRIRKRAGRATGQFLPLTKTEVWSVPKENLEAVKAAAGERGVGVDPLDADWNHIFRPAPAALRLDAQQEAIIERVRSSKATMGIGIVAARAPALVEYALTRDAIAKDPSHIVLTLGEKAVLTLTRTSVEIRPDMCVWRGTAAGDEAPATIMWWPGGKMAGMVQHQGHIYSIRHIGGDVHLIIETSEDRLPQEHAPMPARPSGPRDPPDKPG